VFGQAGRGLVNQLKINPKSVLRTGTLSKAFGAYGGFVAAPRLIKELLISKSRPFIFNTSLPPAILAAAGGALVQMLQNENAGRQLLANAAVFKAQLANAGLNFGDSNSQIVPLLVPGNDRVQLFAARLEALGIRVSAIRSPTVAAGTE